MTTLCSPSVQGELPRCVLILAAAYAEVWNCEVRILATERITGVKKLYTLLLKKILQLNLYTSFSPKHISSKYVCLYMVFQTWLLQGELGTHAQNIQQPCGLRSCPKIREIVVKALTQHQQDNLNLIALYPKRSAINWNNFISWDQKFSVCKFYVHRSMDTIQAGNSQVSVSSDYLFLYTANFFCSMSSLFPLISLRPKRWISSSRCIASVLFFFLMIKTVWKEQYPCRLGLSNLLACKISGIR